MANSRCRLSSKSSVLNLALEVVSFYPCEEDAEGKQRVHVMISLLGLELAEATNLQSLAPCHPLP